MAAGGVVPDDDVQLVVLPPPYMAESLGNGHVDGLCVGAPWNSAAVELGIGHILHFGSEIVGRAAEKVLAVRRCWADENPDVLAGLVRADSAARFVADLANREETAALVAAPRRLNVAPEIVRRTLAGRLRLAPDGATRASDRYLVIGRLGASRPDPVQAAWAYAQMVRWGQAALSADLLAAATEVFRPDLYEAPWAPPPSGLAASRPTTSASSLALPSMRATSLRTWLLGGPPVLKFWRSACPVSVPSQASISPQRTIALHGAFSEGNAVPKDTPMH
jgi:NitT/TauT family transport system ATP-binding protein